MTLALRAVIVDDGYPVPPMHGGYEQTADVEGRGQEPVRTGRRLRVGTAGTATYRAYPYGGAWFFTPDAGGSP